MTGVQTCALPISATENGYGKRTPIADYTKHGRGTQGMIAIQASERNGDLVAAQIVGDDDDIMLITTGGVLIRTRIAEIRDMGRATQGVRLISLGEGEKLAGLQKIVEREDEENGTAPGNGSNGSDGVAGDSIASGAPDDVEQTPPAEDSPGQ